MKKVAAKKQPMKARFTDVPENIKQKFKDQIVDVTFSHLSQRPFRSVVKGFSADEPTIRALKRAAWKEGMRLSFWLPNRLKPLDVPYRPGKGRAPYKGIALNVFIATSRTYGFGPHRIDDFSVHTDPTPSEAVPPRRNCWRKQPRS